MQNENAIKTETGLWDVECLECGAHLGEYATLTGARKKVATHVAGPCTLDDIAATACGFFMEA